MTSKNTRVLVVDDEEDLRELISAELMLKGYEVFMAENGLKAMEVLKQEHIDVVVSDIRMPKMNGIELLDAIKTLSYIPMVMMISAYSSTVTEDELKAKGALCLIPKPFRLKQVISVLEENLKSWNRVPHQKTAA